MKPEVELYNWDLRQQPFLHLTGIAKNHPKKGNSIIRTSRVLHVDWAKNRVETKNTVYLLKSGEPNVAS